MEVYITLQCAMKAKRER